MSYCVKCGVELSDKECRCPLCGTAVYDPESNCLKTQQKTETKNVEKATVRYVRNKYVNITGFCIMILMLILIVINLSTSGTLDWSLIPLTANVFLWFLMVFPVRYSGRLHPVIIIDIMVAAGTVFLMILDALTVFKGWSLITLYSAALACFGVTISILSELKVRHIISLIAAAAAVYVVVLDFHTGFSGWSLYCAGGILVSWSFCLLPLYINRKYNVIGAMFFNSLIVLAYLYFALRANGYADKFFTLALPLVATFCVPVMVVYILWKKFRFSVFGVVSSCFLFVSLAVLSVDRIFNVNIYRDNLMFHDWSLITASLCFAVSVFLFFIEKNYKLRDYLEKKLNI
jgi:hypothetical protein